MHEDTEHTLLLAGLMGVHDDSGFMIEGYSDIFDDPEDPCTTIVDHWDEDFVHEPNGYSYDYKGYSIKKISKSNWLVVIENSLVPSNELTGVNGYFFQSKKQCESFIRSLTEHCNHKEHFLVFARNQIENAIKREYEDKWVYAIRVNHDQIKIGSCSPSQKGFEHRYSECLRWCPDAVVYGIYPYLSVSVEKKIHQLLTDYDLNIRGEVFKFSALTCHLLFTLKSSCPQFDGEGEDVDYDQVCEKYSLIKNSWRFEPMNSFCLLETRELFAF